MKSALPLLAFLISSACTSINLPAGNNFPAQMTSARDIKIFADANGTLYPSGWQQRVPAARVRRGRSLLNGAMPADRAWLEQEQEAQLNQLEKSIGESERVFILTHGFNINEENAGAAFDSVIGQIAPGAGDLVLRLHWDGMLGSGVGAGVVWFPAVGYSQMVGLRALRPILNRASRKKIFLISHSRGASVILSALSAEGVPFDPGFRRATQVLSSQLNLSTGLLDPEPLRDQNNEIRVILLGPAIGYPDFWRGECEPGQGQACNQPADCKSYRSFTPQLRSIQHTLNAGDSTLRKKVAGLSPNFNATNLGWDPSVGATLRSCYRETGPHATVIAAPHPHAFHRYAIDPELGAMLLTATNAAATAQPVVK